MRECRYNIGDMQFNLMEIEHGILRHSSARCKIAGFDYSISFSKNDPRAALVMAPYKPCLPYLIACLCTAMRNSPVLLVLQNPDDVENEMKKAFEIFVSRNIAVDLQLNKVILPKLFDTFREDFGRDTRGILRFISSNIEGSSDIARGIKTLLRPKDPERHGQTISIEYANYDWTLVLTINNK